MKWGHLTWRWPAMRGVLLLLASVRWPATVSELTLRHYVGRYEGDGEHHFIIGLFREHLTLQ